MTQNAVESYVDALEAEACHRSLFAFVQTAWPILEPDTPFVDNWHIRVICEHLEAVHRGEIKRLVINIPPRCMKSLLVSVFYPAWVWARTPGHQFICASHGQALATRDNIKMRQLITSDWYRRHWPHVQLAPDQNAKTEYQNTARGHRIATGLGGGITGFGADTIIVDDPHDVDDAHSLAAIWKNVDSFKSKLYMRLNDRKKGAIIIIMQRLHEADVSGYVLGEVEHEPPPDKWDHVMIPMQFDPDRETSSTLGYYDERTDRAELLWEEKFDDEEVAKLRVSLGTYGAAGQLDQSPNPPEGGMWKRSFIREYTEKVINGKRYVVTDDGIEIEFDKLFKFGAADLAYTKSERADYTVLGAAAGDKKTGFMFVYDWSRERIDLLERTNEDGAHERHILAFIRRAGLQYMGIEKAYLAAQVIKNLQNRNSRVRSIPVDKDKDLRFYGIEHFLESRKFFVPKGAPWVSSFIRECTKYPAATHDDQFDVGVFLCTEWCRIADEKAKIGRHRMKGRY